MASMRDRRRAFLMRNGFFPAEAMELSRSSRRGLSAPYFQRFIKSRRRLLDNAKRYGWTDQQLRDYVRKLYTDKGYIKPDKLGRYRPDVWAMLREHEEAAYRRGEEFESPWLKRIRRKSTKKRAIKRTTRRENIVGWIRELDRTIERTKQEYKRQKLLEQKANLQDQLDRMRD